jgi:hypothetical protein
VIVGKAVAQIREAVRSTSGSQSRTVQSWLPAARVRPIRTEGEALHRLGVGGQQDRFPDLAAGYSRTFLSELAAASARPTGARATDMTPSV